MLETRVDFSSGDYTDQTTLEELRRLLGCKTQYNMEITERVEVLMAQAHETYHAQYLLECHYNTDTGEYSHPRGWTFEEWLHFKGGPK